jgi:hypothetical protein
VFVADRFDPSFRTAEEVIEFLGMPVLHRFQRELDSRAMAVRGERRGWSLEGPAAEGSAHSAKSCGCKSCTGDAVLGVAADIVAGPAGFFPAAGVRRSQNAETKVLEVCQQVGKHWRKCPGRRLRL